MAEQPTLHRYLGRTFNPLLDTARLGRVDAKVYEVLQDGRPHRRRELLDATGGAAINSSVARLRKLGLTITAARHPLSPKSGDWIYTMEAA